MSHSPALTEAYLRMQAARKIHEGCLCRLEAAYYAGIPAEIEMSTSGLLDSSQSLADRLGELVFAAIQNDRIDPVTRRSF